MATESSTQFLGLVLNGDHFRETGRTSSVVLGLGDTGWELHLAAESRLRASRAIQWGPQELQSKPLQNQR